MRTNVYKAKILSALSKAHLLSIASIREGVAGADFSTVFRNVEQLCKEGAVRKVVVSKDVVLYESAHKRKHHDHFVCNSCGTVEEVQIRHIPLKGKAVVSDILIRGTCGKCIK